MSYNVFKTRHLIIKIFLILTIISLVLFLIYSAHGELSQKKTTLLPGWMTIRPPNAVTSLVEWNNTVIAGDNEGVYRINLSTGKVMEKFKQPVSMEYVRNLMIDIKNRLWVCHVNGVSVYDGKVWTNYTKNDGLPDNRTNCILQDENGLMWIGTDNGVGIFDGHTWKSFTTKNGLLVDSVNVIAQHENGSIFFGSNVAPRGGISCLYQDHWSYFDTDSGLPHNHITAFYEDAAGNMWAGMGFTDTGGVCRFDFKNGCWSLTKTLTKKDGLAGEKVCSIFEQKDGTMWFGSEYDGIAFLKKGKWTVIPPDYGLAGSEVKSILYDTYGSMWFATPNGITRLTHEALTALTALVK